MVSSLASQATSVCVPLAVSICCWMLFPLAYNQCQECIFVRRTHARRHLVHNIKRQDQPCANPAFNLLLSFLWVGLEATGGFEPPVGVLQTPALPLGDVAGQKDGAGDGI